jgi:hypothetical protein
MIYFLFFIFLLRAFLQVDIIKGVKGFLTGPQNSTKSHFWLATWSAHPIKSNQFHDPSSFNMVICLGFLRAQKLLSKKKSEQKKKGKKISQGCKVKSLDPRVNNT